MLGQDYVDTFLSSHHRFDYAKEHIIYPRREYFREYRDGEIREGKCRRPFCTKPCRLKRCRPSLLEYHLRESSKNMVSGFPHWRVEPYINYCFKREEERIYGPKWILVSYYDDASVNFIQIDIDRHTNNSDSTAIQAVAALQHAARHFVFDIVWTTSPGYIGDDGKVVHGLYAWIRLDQNHFVMDLSASVIQFLHSIGLHEIANNREGAYLKRKRLVRLPGQFNVELANPESFQKLHQHTPLKAVQVFERAWIQALPLKSEVLTSLTPHSPPIQGQHYLTQCSVTPVPLSPHEDTFNQLLKWGRKIINRHYPDESKQDTCISELVDIAQERLPDTSKTRQNLAGLTRKAKGVVAYLWEHTDPTINAKNAGDEDARRFQPHAIYITRQRAFLLALVPLRLRKAADQILDLLVRFHGRVAVVEIYHGRKTPICTYRNWKMIQRCWGLSTLVEYEKPFNGKGICKQWGFSAASAAAMSPPA